MALKPNSPFLILLKPTVSPTLTCFCGLHTNWVNGTVEKANKSFDSNYFPLAIQGTQMTQMTFQIDRCTFSTALQKFPSTAKKVNLFNVA